MFYIKVFLVTIVLSLVSTYVLKIIAQKIGLTDKPDKERKFHKKETALLGGAAIFFTFFIVLYFFRSHLLVGDLNYVHWLGVFFGALILMIGGFLDDKFDLSATWQIIFPVLAILAVIASGINIEKISNPLGGGFIYLDAIKIPLGEVFGQITYFVIFSDLLIFFWLIGMMYTTKLLDGVDGLVTGVTSIGALIIFFFTVSERYYQPDIALASIVLAAACLGFLVFNWHPASIFLGEGGSLFLGFALGVIAIISGGKFAVALLVMGIPILDVFWTIVRRLSGGKNPFKFADRGHLHFKILDTGIGARKTVLIYYVVSLTFGLSALFLQSRGKVYALSLLTLVMIFLLIFFYLGDKNKV